MQMQNQLQRKYAEIQRKDYEITNKNSEIEALRSEMSKMQITAPNVPHKQVDY